MTVRNCCNSVMCKFCLGKQHFTNSNTSGILVGTQKLKWIIILGDRECQCVTINRPGALLQVMKRESLTFTES